MPRRLHPPTRGAITVASASITQNTSRHHRLNFLTTRPSFAGSEDAEKVTSRWYSRAHTRGRASEKAVIRMHSRAAVTWHVTQCAPARAPTTQSSRPIYRKRLSRRRVPGPAAPRRPRARAGARIPGARGHGAPRRSSAAVPPPPGVLEYPSRRRALLAGPARVEEDDAVGDDEGRAGEEQREQHPGQRGTRGGAAAAGGAAIGVIHARGHFALVFCCPSPRRLGLMHVRGLVVAGRACLSCLSGAGAAGMAVRGDTAG
ncbi:hypothetical protein GQX73_g6186 [Xylaria multiplex]|uniref:Uncharacterized protein n=1 Tax=Xylaria multiplex TaxID=323545 RepID=A0A7C8IMF5_9PEZI|nr:hypothetical protein GQX73_g6186 [Xylaria multiplex]